MSEVNGNNLCSNCSLSRASGAGNNFYYTTGPGVSEEDEQVLPGLSEGDDQKKVFFFPEPDNDFAIIRSKYTATNAVPLITDMFPDRPQVRIRESRIGLDPVKLRNTIRIEAFNLMSPSLEGAMGEIDAVNIGIHDADFNFVPVVPVESQDSYQLNFCKLADWVTNQTQDQSLDLLFFFTYRAGEVNLTRDYHLVFVHIEGGEATIVLPGDNRNQYITLRFTPEITARLIEEYFWRTPFSALRVYYRLPRPP